MAKYTNVKDFDLRKASQMKKEGNIKEFMNRVKEDLSLCVVKGGLFIINMDDSEYGSSEKYDPNLYEFYDPSCFPIQIQDYKDMKSPELLSRLLADTPYTQNGQKPKLNSKFFVAIWSSFRVEEGLDTATLRRRVEERFEISFNIPDMDVMMLKIDFDAPKPSLAPPGPRKSKLIRKPSLKTSEPIFLGVSQHSDGTKMSRQGSNLSNHQ